MHNLSPTYLVKKPVNTLAAIRDEWLETFVDCMTYELNITDSGFMCNTEYRIAELLRLGYSPKLVQKGVRLAIRVMEKAGWTCSDPAHGSSVIEFSPSS